MGTDWRGGVAAAAPTAASSSSHVDVGAAGHHLPPDRRHEARASLTAAPAAVTARGGCRLCRHLRDPPSHPGGHRRRCCIRDDDVGHLPPPRSEGRGRGHTPLAAWTDLLLHRSSSSRSSSIRASVLVCNVVVGERVNRTNW